MSRPFRFGAYLRAPTETSTWTDMARQLETLGYDTLQMPDHFNDQLAVSPALAAAATATTTLRIGALVYGNDYRHPMVLAQELATLDVLSQGRLEIGLGAGWMRSDYEASGMAYDRPGVRIERLEESIEVIYGLLGPEPFSFSGRHYKITNHDGRPKPVQARPPLAIGAGGPRMLALAARNADIVGVNPSLHAGEIGADAIADAMPARFDEKIQRLRTAAGDRFDRIELNVLQQSVQFTPGGDATTEAVAATAELFGMPAAEVADCPLLLIGSASEMAETLLRRRERWGFSYITLPSEVDHEAFAEVINLLKAK